MKILSQRTLLGQQGVNLIERRVQEMGYWWVPSTVPEVGIDGYIEIRDPQTGGMTNLILQVQSKATEKRWTRETDERFDYICEEEDLRYWLNGTAEVLLIMSKPSQQLAYWAPVKEYFRSTREKKGKFRPEPMPISSTSPLACGTKAARRRVVSLFLIARSMRCGRIYRA